MSMKRGGAKFLLLTFLLWPASAIAQTAQVGQITGDVRDTTGGVVRGASVTLVSVERGVSRQAVTDRDGRFLFAVVPPGRYTVVTSFQAFETSRSTDNVVEAEKTTTIAVVLAPAAVREETTVVGETPIVDPTNHTQQMRVRVGGFEKMPYARTFHALAGQAAGVVTSTDGNHQVHGALRSNNTFMFDGVNITDPTAGTIGNSLNFEAIQEVVVRTSTVSAEFGRATGGIVDVITRSGTNRLQGSFKLLFVNDAWNANNSTQSQVPSGDGSYASLARTRFDQVNPTYSGTLGGPIAPELAWFFVAFEHATVTSAERQTNAAPGFSPEAYQQRTTAPFLNLRVSTQLAPSHQVWAKIVRSPTRGFINDYWGTAAEKYALTAQHQGGLSWAAQYSGVFGTQWTGEIMAASADSIIHVVPYSRSPLDDGAPYQDQVDGRFYNGATFDGYVSRPRQQASMAMTYWMNTRHQFKFGVDWQDMRSESAFRFPVSSLFLATGFNPVTREFTPMARLDYDDQPSNSTGSQLSFFVLDRMRLGSRLSVEGGARIERQRAASDVGATTVRATTLSPRASFSWAVTPDGRHLVVGSAGRMFDAVLLGFSDAFARVPQQANYDLYLWDGTGYAYDSRFEVGASTFQPNTSVRPRHMDEITIGTEHRAGGSSGVGVRYIHRNWGNVIDDVFDFNADGSVSRVVQNVSNGTRTYRGVEFTFDRRLADDWTASASYTYSRSRGNHFADDFSPLADFVNQTCQQTVDQGLGDTAGMFPCSDVQSNLFGVSSFDRPHLVKLNGAYVERFNAVDLTIGLVGNFGSKTTYTKSRTVNVLQPGSLVASGRTLTYFYEPRGSDRVPGMAATLDLAVEAGFHSGVLSNAGFRLDVFNLFNSERQTGVNNTAWCQSTATEACHAVVSTYGTATTRASFQTPRAIRLSVVTRWN